MPRKNRRAKIEYRRRLGFNPRKYTDQSRSAVGELSKESIERGGAGDYFEIPKNQPTVRGAVWFANLGGGNGTSVQSGCRPVIIISNDEGNRHADTLAVLPLTTRMKKPYLPTHVSVNPTDLTEANPLRPFQTSMVLAEQIATISKSDLCSYLGRIAPGPTMDRINEAVKVQLGV